MDKYFSLRVSAMLPILATYFVIFYKKNSFLILILILNVIIYL